MIAGCILLFALQVTPELQRHIESGLRAKSAGAISILPSRNSRASPNSRLVSPRRMSIWGPFISKRRIIPERQSASTKHWS